MIRKTKVPVGVENFAEMRRDGFYYIDKTGIIRDLLENQGKVNLFTRPRRFGKTLNIEQNLSFQTGKCIGYLCSRSVNGLKRRQRKTISIRDSYIRNDMKENFYHGVLLGLLGNMTDWKVRSNAETGDGYSDISVEIEEKEIGIVIELKYAENAGFDAACNEAMKQIKDRRYEEVLIDDGMKLIYRYGIACYKKRCKVVSG